MKIVELDNINRIIEEPFVGWFRDQNLIMERSIDVMAKVWSGAYRVFVAIDDNFEPKGMIVCSMHEGMCRTILIHAKGQVMQLRDQFYGMLPSYGCNRVSTYSHERSKAYERLIGMKHVYSYYEKEVL